MKQLGSSMSDRLKIKKVETLSQDWSTLKKTTFEYRRNDGTWQNLTRETYDRGNGAVICPYNPSRKTVILTRQFRYAAYVSGYEDFLIEACAGLLDDIEPEHTIKRELEEETGYRVGRVEKVFELFMSPGSVTEKLHFFIAEYSETEKAGSGGGNYEEGEDISVTELLLVEALDMVRSGKIIDGKTVILLQYLESQVSSGGGKLY
jgi:nudix-type nucleoside diphosphatase (YffH/AdpP family)